MADQQSPQNLGGNLSAVQAINLGSALSTPPATAGPDLSPSFVGGPPGSNSSNTSVFSGGATTFSTFAKFTMPAPQGAFAIAQDTNALYCANNGNWFIIGVLA